MPVRIYDISKKLGLENKEVLAKARELGITAAKVPSSSLDKITAEYLEQELSGGKPVATAAPPAPPAEPEKILIVTAPPAPAPVIEPAPLVEAKVPAPAAPVHEQEVKAPIVSPAPIVEEAPVEVKAPEPVKEAPQVIVAEVKPAPVVEETPKVEAAPVAPAPKPEVPVAPATPIAATPPPPPAPPARPAGPQVGDKVGFIQLPSKPAPRTAEKVGSAKLPPSRPGQQPGGNRPDFSRGGNRPDNRNARPGFGAPHGGRPQAPGGRPGFGNRNEPAKPAAPSGPRFVTPDNAQVISVKPPIVVRELAEQLKLKPFKLIADLMELGVFANVNQAIDESVAQRICAKYGYRFEVEKRERGSGIIHAPIKKIEVDIEDKPEQLKPRAPVVTIMGHVDHGKTTLLDVIRKSDVVAGEAGGITQHIGAYTISFPHPERKNELQQITFLDTPGHAAFSAMRARGANVTDIVVLVVAANDGVMPQTLEALSHAQAAKAEIMVAVNKVDHPNANPMRVRQQLQEKGLVCEEWGGKTLFVDVSAITKQGVDKLLEAILLQAEIMELKANPDRRAKGNVIESGLEPGGPTATVLVRKGTLHLGDVVICGPFYGKVRALINEENKRLKEAGPSVAVKLLGLNGVPEAGLEFTVEENEKEARDIAEKRTMEARAMGQEARAKVTLENLFATMSSTSAKVLKLVVKADTQGSVEAIVEALKKIESDKVSLEVIHSAVGTITESDVALASASNAVILGFHTRIDNGVSDEAKREGVQIKLYAIIYELIDQVKESMAGLLDPLYKDVVVGTAEVRKIFELSKGIPVAGCMITNGRIVRGKVRVMRRKGLIFEGVTQSLRRFQDEVNEVRAGMECGIRLDGFGDFQIGDTIECYTVEKTTQKL
ncbi:translation initiation factor IF-2 [Pedosphaera parvula]|uniref:Translation initiation factor IF-2 n=1 Tax=Pedosphaera parvula (strain Ellin514) TaxID=320771 RepID=B9XFC1_PEDPL|nr:translation initiation factor IF-2 [Pedosphaera parvula]EEF61285.1 translation initiation factor IF-2 [Pedosphaera parvula Ellin514]